MSVIILLAVGSDYNLLLVARFKEEIHAGLNTGIIRAMGGTGSVVTAAGLVFAFTMMSLAVSELTVIAQVGTTIGLGLLFDTLIVRSLMTPSIAALLGRWFWWPQWSGRGPSLALWPSPPSPSETSHRCDQALRHRPILDIPDGRRHSSVSPIPDGHVVGGYCAQTSVVWAATPLLLKNSFAQLGHLNASGSP